MERLFLPGVGRGNVRLEYSCYAVLGGMAFFLVAMPFFGKSYVHFSESVRTVLLILPLHVVLLLSVLVPALLMDRDIPVFEKLGIRKVGLGACLKAATFGIFAFPLLMLVSIGFSHFLNLFGVEVEVQPVVNAMIEGGDTSFFIMGFSAVFIAPVTEELVFRHVLFSRFAPSLGVVAAAFVASLFFTAVHYSLLQFPAIMLLGFLLQYIYIKSNSVVPAMIAHGIYNACAVLCLVYGRYSGVFDF